MSGQSLVPLHLTTVPLACWVGLNLKKILWTLYLYFCKAPLWPCLLLNVLWNKNVPELNWTSWYWSHEVIYLQWLPSHDAFPVISVSACFRGILTPVFSSVTEMQLSAVQAQNFSGLSEQVCDSASQVTAPSSKFPLNVFQLFAVTSPINTSESIHVGARLTFQRLASLFWITFLHSITLEQVNPPLIPLWQTDAEPSRLFNITYCNLLFQGCVKIW